MRLIDADTLLTQIKYKPVPNILNETWNELYERVIEEIDNAPTVEPQLSDKQIEKIADLLETEWGYEGIREDVSRILKGEEQ